MAAIIQRLGAWLEKRDREQTLALLNKMADAIRTLGTTPQPARRRRACFSMCRTRTAATVMARL